MKLKDEKNILVLHECDEGLADKHVVIASYYDLASGASCLNKRSIINSQFCDEALSPEVLGGNDWRFVGDADVAMVECVSCEIRTMNLQDLSAAVHKEDCAERARCTQSHADMLYDHPRISEDGERKHAASYHLRTPKQFASGRLMQYCSQAFVVMEESVFEERVFPLESLDFLRKEIIDESDSRCRELAERLGHTYSDYVGQIKEKHRIDFYLRCCKVDMHVRDACLLFQKAILMMQIEEDDQASLMPLQEAEKEEIDACSQCRLLVKDERDQLRSMMGELKLVSSSLADFSEEYVEIMSAHEAVHWSGALKQGLVLSVPTFLHAPLASAAVKVIDKKCERFRYSIEKSLLHSFLDKDGILGFYINKFDEKSKQENMTRLQKMISDKRLNLCESIRMNASFVTGVFSEFYDFVAMKG